jgi:hypothetical protein
MDCHTTKTEERNMVANIKEVKKMMHIFLTWLPESIVLGILEELMKDIGNKTENESLRDTLRLLHSAMCAEME